MDNRIGTLNKDGSIDKYPEVNVNGDRYERPCSICQIGKGYFVALPFNFAAPELLDELRLKIQDAAKKVKTNETPSA